MNSDKYIIHPYVRLLFLVVFLVGTIFNDNILHLIIVYLFVLIPLFIIDNKILSHFKLVVLGIIPIFLTLILLYIFIYKKNDYGWDFILNKTIKLTVYTSVFQLGLLVPAQHLITTLTKWGLKGETLLVVLSAFTVPNDIISKSEKILDARFSRGFIKKRTFLNKSKQLAFVLIPLIIGVIRTSQERAESWEEKNIISLLNNYKSLTQKINYSYFLNISLTIICIIWLILPLTLK